MVRGLLLTVCFTLSLTSIACSAQGATKNEKQLVIKLQKRYLGSAQVECYRVFKRVRCSWSLSRNGSVVCQGKASKRLKKKRFKKWRIQKCAPLLDPPSERAPLYFGFNDDWHHLGGSYTLEDAKLDPLLQTRANVIRFPFDWREVQPEGASQWRWSTYDPLYQASKARGVKWILNVQGTPCWARESVGCSGFHGSWRPDVDKLDEFQAFTEQAIQRYGDNLVAVEAWNEENMKPFYLPEPDPEYYVQILKAVERARDNTRPDLPLLFGGLASLLEDTPEGMDFRSFLRRAYQAGAGGYFDAISFHPYALTAWETEVKMNHLRQVLQENGDRGMDVWITEFGLRSDVVGEWAQAEGIAQIYQYLSSQDDVAAVVVHRLYDDNYDAEQSLGVMWSTQTPKLAFCYLASLRGSVCS